MKTLSCSCLLWLAVLILLPDRVGADVSVLRDGIVVYTGEVSSLRRFKDDVRNVASGFECGIGLSNFNDIKEGDVIEAFEVREVART